MQSNISNSRWPTSCDEVYENQSQENASSFEELFPCSIFDQWPLESGQDEFGNNCPLDSFEFPSFPTRSEAIPVLDTGSLMLKALPQRGIISQLDQRVIGGAQHGGTNTESTESRKKTFACPYYKHNPQKFRRARTCAGPGFSGIHRLKEHLYCGHGYSQHTCRRCLRDYKSVTGLSKHLRASELCVVKPTRQAEGRMSIDQQAELQSKKRMPPNTTDKQRWNLIYGILFPGIGPMSMPSPYFEDEDEKDVLALQDSSNISSHANGEDLLELTPTADLERSVKADIWHIICTSSDDHAKMERIYEIVCGFPKRLINKERVAF